MRSLCRRFFHVAQFPLAVLLLVAGPLRADELKFPSDGSGIVLSIPDGWKFSESKDGSVKCTSAEGDFTFELLPGRVVDDVDLATAAAGLADASGLRDVRTEDGGENVNSNGVKITGRIVHGTKGGVEYVGVVSILTPPSGERCAFQCFGSKTTLAVNSKAMSHITASFRGAK